MERLFFANEHSAGILPVCCFIRMSQNSGHCLLTTVIFCRHWTVKLQQQGARFFLEVEVCSNLI